MRRIIPAILALSLVLFGCKVKELADKAQISKDLDKRGTLDLMKEVSKDKYDPPKDGRLTDAQVQMYLKVRHHEADIAKAALEKANEHAKNADAAKNSISGVMESFKTISAAGQFATADLRAAKDLGYNTQEYLWVKAQVIGVSMLAFSETMTKTMDAQLQSSQSQMRKAYDEAKDEQSKQLAKQMLDNYEKTVKEGKEATAKVDPAVAYNRELLKKYDAELAGLTTELAKTESKEGDAKKGMDELMQKLNKATEDAKKQSQ